MRPERTTTFADELLADGSVCRRYDDGRIEWRRHDEDRHVTWRDQAGGSGTDELLADGIVKRTHVGGRVEYGREQGYGRTAWQGGRLLTVNRSSLGGQAGAVLTALGATALMGSLVPPPEHLTLEQEAELRRRAQQSTADGGGGDGGSSDTGSSSDTGGDLAEHAGDDGGDLGGDGDTDSDFG
jgi:hypothetical protein